MVADHAQTQDGPHPRNATLLMKILVGCEWSGRVRDAFRARGHDAWSCDIEPTPAGPNSEFHILGDVKNHLGGGWDMLIAFPPCTYLSTADASNKQTAWREEQRDKAFAFVATLWDSPIEKIAIENPTGRLSTRWRVPSQYIQPFWFGDPYTKRTALWLKNLPLLERDEHYWHGPVRPWTGTAHSSKARAVTFRGVARAMAEQWG